MSTPCDPRPVRISDRLYRALLRAYPRAFRTQYREEMNLVFRDWCRDAYQGAGLKGLLRVWRRGIVDLGENLPREMTQALAEEVAQRPWRRSCSGCNNEVASDWQTCRYCGTFLIESTTYSTRITPVRHTFRRNLDGYLDHYRTEGIPGNPPG